MIWDKKYVSRFLLFKNWYIFNKREEWYKLIDRNHFRFTSINIIAYVAEIANVKHIKNARFQTGMTVTL